jgi:hypothetical protein
MEVVYTFVVLLLSLKYYALIVLSDCICLHANNRHVTHIIKDTKVRKNEHTSIPRLKI